MKNTTIKEVIVVKQYWNEDFSDTPSTTEFAFIEDAERVFNFSAKTVRVFRRKVTVVEEEIETEFVD